MTLNERALEILDDVSLFHNSYCGQGAETCSNIRKLSKADIPLIHYLSSAHPSPIFLNLHQSSLFSKLFLGSKSI